MIPGAPLIGARRDPYRSQVKLLLAPQAADSGIRDHSPVGRTVSLVGNAALSQAVADPWGGNRKLIAFDGGGDALQTPVIAADNLGTANFTIEAWVYPTAGPTVAAEILTVHDGVSNSSWTFRLNASRQPLLYGAGSQSLVGSAISLNAWTFVWVTRSGTAVTIGDGAAQRNSATVAGSYSYGSTANLTIGSHTTAAAWFFTGYIAAVRITAGVARAAGDRMYARPPIVR